MAVSTQVEAASTPVPTVAEPVKSARGGKRPGAGHPFAVKPPEPETQVLENDETQVTGRNDFWVELANFSPEDWNRHIAYLYRVAPKIDRKANGKPANIQQYSCAFTVEDIMREHGSGAYQVHLNYIDPASGKSHRIARELFTIINPKYPPVVPPGDWVDDKSNENWRWGVPAGAVQSGVVAAGYPPGFNMDKVYDRAFEMAEKLAPKRDNASENALLVKLAELSDPTRIINLMQTLTPKPDTSATDKLFALMNETLKDTRAELRELRDRQAAPPKSIIEQVTELRPVIGEFAALFAERSAGRGNVWEDLLGKVVDQAPAVIDLIKTGQQQRGNGTPEWNPQLPQVAAPTTPTATPAATSTAAAPAAELTEEQRVQQAFKALMQKWQGHIMHFSAEMVNHFKCDQGGVGGYYFRDRYLDLYGRLRWADMRTEIGPDLLATLITQHPQLSQEIKPPEKLKRFTAEFFTLEGEEKDTEVESGDAREAEDENEAA